MEVFLEEGDDQVGFKPFLVEERETVAARVRRERVGLLVGA